MNAVIEQRDAALSQVSIYKYIITQYQISFFLFFFFFFCFTFGEDNDFVYFVENLKESPYMNG